MRSKFGTLCMVIGAALVLAALSLFLFNQQEAQAAGASAEVVLPKVIRHIQAPTEAAAEPAQETEPAYPDPFDPTMTEVEIDGYSYIGYVSIPTLNLELPVMADWDYDRLAIAPCRYVGSTKSDDLVIAAHNFAQHFGKLSSLSPGDLVYFVDMDGVLSSYEVVELDILAPTAVEEMTSGEFDLTLFTCTYGGQSRVTVRCARVENGLA